MSKKSEKKGLFANFAHEIELNDPTMKAFVNDTEGRTYYGAKVKSVVLANCRAKNLPINLDDIEVKDAFGNVIGLDGSLRANSKIYVKF